MEGDQGLAGRNHENRVSTRKRGQDVEGVEKKRQGCCGTRVVGRRGGRRVEMNSKSPTEPRCAENHETNVDFSVNF